MSSYLNLGCPGPGGKARTLLASGLLAMLIPGLTWAQTDLSALRARAEKGESEAINELGNAYASGKDVPQNLPEALRLYGRAAESGHAAALFNLGMMYELGRGVAADPAAAFQFYLKAARQGFAPAQFNVANMYANGIGVPVDLFEAALWFRQAADRNVAEAQYNLALAYELGRGLTKDEVAALRWYRAAAAQGFARAQFNLALMLEEGRGGPANSEEALTFYRAAAAQNFTPAQNNLGILLAERRTGTDLVEAYVWLALAVENGAKSTGRDLVAGELTPAQLADANTAIARRRQQLGLSDRTAPAEPIKAPSPRVTPDATAASASNSEVPSSTGSDAEIARLAREVARLNQAAERLTQEKVSLEQRLTASESRWSEAIARVTAAESKSKLNTASVVAVDAERVRLAQELMRSQTSLAEARHAADLLQTEITRLKSAAAPDAPLPMPEQPALLTQLEKLTRENATLRTEKIDLAQRAAELTAQLNAIRGSPVGSPVGAPKPPDTRFIPLQELATTDRRIAKLMADNTRLQEFIKRSAAELSELNRDLRRPEERPVIKEGQAVTAAPPGR